MNMVYRKQLLRLILPKNGIVADATGFQSSFHDIIKIVSDDALGLLPLELNKMAYFGY